MDPTQFRKIGSKKLIDLRTLDETDEETYNSVYYKEYPLVTADMDETLIVTYSPKYAAYQRRIREKLPGACYSVMSIGSVIFNQQLVLSNYLNRFYF